MWRSISSSTSSGSLRPSPEKIFTPLSVHGLCEAETTTPASAPSSFARNATAGVGTTPAKRTRPPAFVRPPVRAHTMAPEDSRVSQPDDDGGVRVPERRRERRADARDRRGVERRLARLPADAVGSEQPAHSDPMLRERGASRASQRREEAQRLGDVVDAHEDGARARRLRAEGHGRERLGEPVRNGRSRDRPEERLARRADDERDAGRREAVQRAEEGEVLLRRLAESEAGVEEDIFCSDSGGERAGTRLAQVGRPPRRRRR